MEPMNTSDMVLTGIPRGGTTLACHLLAGARNTLALFEPMPVHQLPIDHEAALDAVVAYFAQVRERALTEGLAPSKHRDGRVPDNPYGERDDTGGVRPWLADLGDIEVGKSLTPDFRLIIKHNSAFVALLPVLARQFPIIGVVRNPLAVLASWRSVDLPVTHGRLPAGERLDPELAAALAAQPDNLRRQIIILDWFFARLQRWVSPQRLIRYEDTVASQGAALLQAAGLELADLSTPLHSRNVNAQYDADEVSMLANALSQHAVACWRTYSSEDVEALAIRMSSASEQLG